jgi:hypothetical protein
VLYASASAEASIGGDFYEALEPAPRRGSPSHRQGVTPSVLLSTDHDLRMQLKV